MVTKRSSRQFYKGENIQARDGILAWLTYYCSLIIYSFVSLNLVPRVSRARRDPGRVWSRASVTIENTREGSSLNKEFVAFVALIHGVVKFLQTQPRLRRAILLWPSWTDFYNVKRLWLNRTIYSNLWQTMYMFSSAFANYYHRT